MRVDFVVYSKVSKCVFFMKYNNNLQTSYQTIYNIVNYITCIVIFFNLTNQWAIYFNGICINAGEAYMSWI